MCDGTTGTKACKCNAGWTGGECQTRVLDAAAVVLVVIAILIFVALAIFAGILIYGKAVKKHNFIKLVDTKKDYGGDIAADFSGKSEGSTDATDDEKDDESGEEMGELKETIKTDEDDATESF